MDYEQFKAEYKAYFLDQLKLQLDHLDAGHRPDEEKQKAILASSFDVVVSEEMLHTIYEEIRSQNDQPDTPDSDTALEWRTPGWIRDLDPTKNKDVCIGLHVAAASALVAAWVASGGTLTVGAVAGGIKITSPIMAALIGGAGGRGIAEVMCR